MSQVRNLRKQSMKDLLLDKYNDHERNDSTFVEEYMKPYFLDLFTDLSRRCRKRTLSRTSFVEYSRLPFFLGERLFASILHSQGKITGLDFFRGLSKIFLSDIDTKLKFTFAMYAFSDKIYI